MSQPKHFYAFGPFRLDAGKRVLVRDGIPVSLTPKAAETLLALVENAGHLVEKDELMNRVWPGAFVEEGNLAKNILVLRKVLGQWDGVREYIETVPKRGYRLIAPVEEVTHAEVPPPGKVRTERDLIGKRVSHYRVLEVVGGGGMGLVYKAEDLKLGRQVALKFLPEELATDPDSLQRFEREARTASSLDHLNICTIYEVEEHEGHPFIVMQLLEGETLRDRLTRRDKEPLPLDQLLDIGLQACDGLAAAHQKGIIHRDIKPANIFITTSGQVKILDFGLAKLVPKTDQVENAAAATQGEAALKGQAFRRASAPGPELHALQHRAGRRRAANENNGDSEGTPEGAPFQNVDSPDATLTRTGLAMGTAGYMSPEQVRGETLDARADLFSLGLVLYEMATGRRTFSGETAAILHDAILNQTPVPVMELNPDVPAKLASAITKALEKDRERRYPSASEMRADLAEVRTARGTWLRPLSRGLGTAALLVVVAASAWLYQRARGQITLTNQDTIVLADFTNHTSDLVFGDALNTALRTEMEQTPFLKLLSSDKVRGTLKQTGRSEGAKLTVEVARDVCIETNSKAVVAGSITDVGNGYRVGVKAVGCQSGKTLATAEAVVANRDEIVQMLGVAGSELRRKLGEPKESLQNFSKPLEEATSASPEALQAYTEGVREEPQRLTAAAPHFKRATELDPNYAMAYAWQAALGSSEVTTKAAANKAYELRARLTDRDRFAVEHVYYRDVTGELEKAVAVYEQWTRTFPLDSVPRIGLAIALSSLGQHERSAAEAREAIRLEPGIDGYCYLMLADIALGRFDDAKTVYEEALAHKFDSLELRLARYRLAFLQNDDAAMQEQVAWAAKTPSAEGPMLWSQLNVEAYRGHVGAAHGYAQRVMDWGHRMGSSGSDPEHKATEAMMDAEAGFLDRAHEEANWALGRASELSARLNVAMALARVGDVPAAQKLVEELNQEYPLDTLTQNYYLPTLRALIALHTNNPGQAIEALRRATPYELAKTNAIDQLYPAYVRGLAYLQSGQGPQAAAEFQKLLDHPGIVAFWLTGPLAYLQLARAQIMMGDQAAARKSYQEFLTLWKDADPDIPIYKQVKAEYAKLQ